MNEEFIKKLEEMNKINKKVYKMKEEIEKDYGTELSVCLKCHNWFRREDMTKRASVCMSCHREYLKIKKREQRARDKAKLEANE